MKFPRAFLAASILAPCLASAALAAEMVVPAVKTVAPVVQSFPGRSVDVLGVAPGMTESEIRAILAEKLPGTSVKAPQIKVGIEYKGVRAVLDKFVGELEASSENDHIKAVLSSPISDSRAIIVRRDLSYKDVMQAPTVASMIEALKTKYGKPSLENKGARVTQLEWYLTGKNDHICPTGSTKTQYCKVSVRSDRNDFGPVKEAVDSGFKMGVYASIYSLEGSDKVNSLSVVINDFTNHLADLNGVDAILKGAVDKGLTNTAPVKPAL